MLKDKKIRKKYNLKKKRSKKFDLNQPESKCKISDLVGILG
jgi:ribosomal protein S17